MIQTGVPASRVQCHQLEMLSTKNISKGSPKVQGIVQTHEKVFQDLPIKIPPNKEHEHPIEVKKGPDPVNIKSCRYPHHQKIELEKMLHNLFKMWEARARRSSNPGVRQRCPSLRIFEDKASLREGQCYVYFINY